MGLEIPPPLHDHIVGRLSSSYGFSPAVMLRHEASRRQAVGGTTPLFNESGIDPSFVRMTNDRNPYTDRRRELSSISSGVSPRMYGSGVLSGRLRLAQLSRRR